MREDGTEGPWVDVPSTTRWRCIDGEILLLNLVDERYYGLSDLGVELWELLIAGTTREAAIHALLERYDVEREVIAGDLDQLVGKLVECQLVSSGVSRSPETSRT